MPNCKLKPSDTITGDAYRQQLLYFNRSIEDQQPELENIHN